MMFHPVQEDSYNCGLLVIMSLVKNMFLSDTGSHVPLIVADVDKKRLVLFRANLVLFFLQLFDMVKDIRIQPYKYHEYDIDINMKNAYIRTLENCYREGNNVFSIRRRHREDCHDVYWSHQINKYSKGSTEYGDVQDRHNAYLKAIKSMAARKKKKRLPNPPASSPPPPINEPKIATSPAPPPINDPKDSTSPPPPPINEPKDSISPPALPTNEPKTSTPPPPPPNNEPKAPTPPPPSNEPKTDTSPPTTPNNEPKIPTPPPKLRATTSGLKTPKKNKLKKVVFDEKVCVSDRLAAKYIVEEREHIQKKISVRPIVDNMGELKPMSIGASGVVSFLVKHFTKRLVVEDDYIRDMLNDHGCIYVKDIAYDDPTDVDDAPDSRAKYYVQSACIMENIIRKKKGALFLHIMCTAIHKDSFHYGKMLIQWIASKYHDNPIYVYTIIDPSDMNVQTIEYSEEQQHFLHVQRVLKRGNAIMFFDFMGFKEIEDMDSFKIGYTHSGHDPFVSLPIGYKLLRATTSHLASHDLGNDSSKDNYKKITHHEITRKERKEEMKRHG